MREIRKSGSMSGERKRSDAAWPKLPRLSSTLLSVGGLGVPVFDEIMHLHGLCEEGNDCCLVCSTDHDKPRAIEPSESI